MISLNTISTVLLSRKVLKKEKVVHTDSNDRLSQAHLECAQQSAPTIINIPLQERLF
jgi:hypothetical protein